MKIALSSTGPTLEDNVESRFGRCAYFLVVDPDTLEFEAMENPNISLGGGAGIQSAQMMADKGVSHVLTGNCGPNAFQVFGAAGIQVITGVTGQAAQVVQQFKEGSFQSSSSANVQSHFGMGMGRGIAGGGRGMGGGMGQGMGGATGMGRGMGMRRGMSGAPTVPAEPSAQPASRISENRDIDALKSQARTLAEQLHSVRQSIDSIEKGDRSAPVLVASVNPDKCDACGICADTCPESAISINDTAHINQVLCVGCGQCVAECPQGALSLKKAEPRL